MTEFVLLRGRKYVIEQDTLDLRGRHIHSISEIEGINNIHLKNLNLSYNYLQNLDGLNHIEGLESLNLSFNEIKDIRPLAKLGSLIDLDLAYNRIKALDGVQNLPHLRTLYMEENSVSVGIRRNVPIENLLGPEGRRKFRIAAEEIPLPPSISKERAIMVRNALFRAEQHSKEQFVNLKHMEVYNPQGYIQRRSDAARRGVIRENTLWLAGLTFTNFPFLRIGLDESQMNSVHRLYLQNTGLIGLGDVPENLEVLDLSNNDLPVYSRIHQGECKFRTRKCSSLGTSHKLKTLNFSRNLIDRCDFEDWARDFPNLEELNFSHNRIKYVRGLDGLDKLRYLNLGHNEIETVSMLNSLKSLIYLDLSHNQIKSIVGLESLPSLEVLDLHSNPDGIDYSSLQIPELIL